MQLSYLGDELRRVDYDRYLLSLFAPRRCRPHLWALYLFVHEIAKTRDVVSDTTLGLIRLQWWRDEIGRIYEKQPCGQNPVLSTLAEAIALYGLAREDFETLIYAHEFDLEDRPPTNLEGLHHYVDFTTTPLWRLALKIVGEDEEPEILKRAAVAEGLIRLVRQTPHLLKQGRCLLPEDLIREVEPNAKSIFDIKDKSGVFRIVRNALPPIGLKFKAKSSLLKYQLRISAILLNNLYKNQLDVFSARVQMLPRFFALRVALGAPL